jgi:glycosyltransferase involved in cell wall biosynthesis
MSKKHAKKSKYPLISLCTPTFNRRPFIPFMIKCFDHQTYPKDRIEWIIIDDGTDPIEDLVKNVPQVKYFYYKDKMELGKKRNLMHSKCSGDIIIYMDDDDYYPEERISHAVKMLQDNPSYLLAGSSEMHIYYDSQHKIYQCGPYKQYHATAATFAFRKKLLEQTYYDETNSLAEENAFTKKYTIPLLQLDTLKTIFVCSHAHNSLNKERLLENIETNPFVKESKYNINDFINDPILRQFYITDMNNLLTNYEPGRLENKPLMIEQIAIIDKKRQQMTDEQERRTKLKQETENNGKSMTEMKSMTEKQNIYEKKLSEQTILINELFKKVKELSTELATYKNKT